MKPASDERTPDGGEYLAARPDREQLLSVRSTDRDDAVVLTVEGDVDGLTAPRLGTALASAFNRLGGRLLVVDLSRVVFLGSSGLRTLHESALVAAREHDLDQLRIVVDHTRPVIRPIEIVGLDQVLALFNTVSDALAAGDLR
ncbi:STAS domain-containing protein [Actinophytocola gossypii]|uniref:STAS domain-containing protein n=1 Tax=Actinophytocola gossypii TaxID=2812003 RepID=A0ABT2JGD3_9PSEU|nr:STAS domain-containing protein [Actinophytocola gossypii]MCT2586920.1 STAS domain-containing protein [Actinophytocola gossypii]